MSTNWTKISLFFLFIVAVIGSLLRATHHISLPFAFDHLLHAHSHVAFQGWLYTVLYLLTTKLYLTETQIKIGRYPLQFKLTVTIIFGILISFSIQGYGLFSIIFSSLFQLMNYWFIYSFLRDSKVIKTSPSPPNISLLFIKTGLWLGLLSTLAPWGIGILSAKGLKGSEAYQSFIYFFLHFQYNGWYLFMTLGLLYKLLEKGNIKYHYGFAKRFYWMFTLAVIPALALSFLGLSFRNFVIIPAVLAAVLQLLGMVYLVRSIFPSAIPWLKKSSRWFLTLMSLFIISIILKTILQFLSVLPIFQEIAFSNRSIILSYLHLSFIGVLTLPIFGILIKLKWLTLNSFIRVGVGMFAIGFVITEWMLLKRGMHLVYYTDILLLGSLMMAFGASVLTLSPRLKN